MTGKTSTINTANIIFQLISFVAAKSEVYSIIIPFWSLNIVFERSYSGFGTLFFSC